MCATHLHLITFSGIKGPKGGICFLRSHFFFCLCSFPYELNINIQDSIEISCKQNDTMGAAIIYLVTEKGFQDCSAEGNNRITDPAPIFGSGINLRSDSECGGCFFYCRGPNSLLDTNQITFNFVQNIEDGTTAYLIGTEHLHCTADAIDIIC